MPLEPSRGVVDVGMENVETNSQNPVKGAVNHFPLGNGTERSSMSIV